MMIQNLEKNKNCFVHLISSQEQPPRNKSILSFTNLADQDEASRVGLQPASGQSQGGSGVNVGSVLSTVSPSVTQAEWECRYEEGRNYSDDMMRDPGVILSHQRRLHSAWSGV